MCVVCLSTRCLVERCIMSSCWLQCQRGHVGLVTLGWSELWAELTVSIDTGLNDRREKWVTKFKKNCFVGCIRRSIEQTTSSWFVPYRAYRGYGNSSRFAVFVMLSLLRPSVVYTSCHSVVCSSCVQVCTYGHVECSLVGVTALLADNVSEILS